MRINEIVACSKTDPCALHEEWSRSRDTIISMLEKNGIAQMAVKMHKPQYRTKGRLAGKKRAPSKTAPPKPAL